MVTEWTTRNVKHETAACAVAPNAAVQHKLYHPISSELCGISSEVRKQLKLPVFNIMTPPQLRRLLKDRGLCDKGDRLALINRYTQYVVLHNANLDRVVPESEEIVLQQLHKSEAQRGGGGMAMSTVLSKSFSLNNDQNKAHFAAMKNEILARRNQILKKEEKENSDQDAPVSSTSKQVPLPSSTSSHIIIHTTNNLSVNSTYRTHSSLSNKLLEPGADAGAVDNRLDMCSNTERNTLYGDKLKQLPKHEYVIDDDSSDDALW
jgi:hypothetical protein